MDAPEPYRAKVVERIRLIPREDRERALMAAGFNLFGVASEDVFIDLLTDSGTGAVSDAQLAAMMRGDEAYAGSRSFRDLADAVRDVLGFPFVIPTHQGRGAEHVLDLALLGPGRVVVGNAPFDTTRAHIGARGASVVDCTVPESEDPSLDAPFKGNVDVIALDRALDSHAGRVGYVLVTITCNSRGGHPVSMENLEAVAKVSSAHGVPFFLDGARFAENAILVKQREPGWRGASVAAIVRRTMDLADGALVSGKKNALVPIGGFLALRDEATYEACAPHAVLHEGFLTYGGLAGHDLAAMAVGLREGVDEDHLAHRVGQVRRLADQLERLGVPVVRPPGGHAAFVDAGASLPHVPRHAFPGQAFACALYAEAGVRAVEVGSLLAGRDPASGEQVRAPLELLRLAVPARVYSDAHLAYAAEAAARVVERRDRVRGLRIEREPPVLRHFTSTFRPI